MPIYEYLCKTCNLMTVEARSAEKRDDLPQCSGCKEPMKRIFSTPGISFKGSGFYSTDK